MRFYNAPHPFYCGIDRHARTMDVCIMDHQGEIVVHRNMQAGPDPFLKTIAPSREDLVVCVACIFPWYWLADLCARAGIPCVLGHALYRKAIHGGQAKNDKIDAQKIAVLLRGRMLPQPMSIPRRGGRRGICSGAGCLSRANGPSCSRTSSRRTVSTPSRRLEKSSRTKPTGMAWRNGLPILQCRKVSQSTWH